MAEDKKPKEKKVEEKKVEDKQTLQQQLDSITFKNAQAQKIMAIQKNEQRLKDNLGRNKNRYISSTQGSGNARRRVSSAGNIAGLHTLGNSFGK
jgi:transposase